MLQCDLHQNLNYGCYLCLTLESAPSHLDLLPLKALAIIVASDLELMRKLISVTIGNVKMYARLRLRPLISFKGMRGNPRSKKSSKTIVECWSRGDSRLRVSNLW